MYVASTLHEGFGLTFLEAMACGLPIVTFDNGGHTDFLVDGKSGYLVTVGNVDGLCKQVEHLYHTPLMRMACRKFNKQLAEDYYIENCTEQYEKTFQGRL